MSFIVTERAFRFTFGNTDYALDAQTDGIVYGQPAIHLFFKVSDGWNRVTSEMDPAMYVRQADIDHAGGLVNFCELVRQKVNRALAILHGGVVDIQPGTAPHELVADFLRNNLKLTVVDGVPALQFKT